MLTTIVAGMFVLGVVVLVHEFGHFIVAKKAGVFVKTFSVGFGRKILRRRFGDTVYALSVLPFGGYVKFAGESEFGGEVEEAAEEDEAPPGPNDEIPDRDIPPSRYFLRKRGSVRAAVLLAGPFMNYVTAVVLYIGVFFVQGVQVVPTRIIGEVTPGGPADSVGIVAFDEIVAVDGELVRDWSEVQAPFVADATAERTLRLRRGAEQIEVVYRPRVVDGRVQLGFAPHISSRIGRVQKGKPAWRAGIRSGDVIEAVADTMVTTYDEVRRMIHARPGVPVAIRWRHDGVARADTVVPEPKEVLQAGSGTEFTTVGVIGIGPHYERRRESLFASVTDGFSAANGMIATIVVYLKQLFTGRMGVKTLGGPILITQMAGDVANWGFDYLLLFLAFFNINLCIFNLLPLLPFDGGHLALLTWEGVTRRPINRRLREWMTQGGFILIILLMAFVVMLDLSRCSGGVRL
jgi:regulator of sigma E protease